MTDLDPEIWNNPTLGAAAPNERLDRLERQQIEDRAAKFEDREPREIVVDNTYPDWKPEVSERTGTVPSNYQTVHFADEQQNDIPVDSGQESDTAAGIPSEETEGGNEEPTETESPTNEEGQESTVPENVPGESTESNSAEEGSTTKWT